MIISTAGHRTAFPDPQPARWTCRKFAAQSRHTNKTCIILFISVWFLGNPTLDLEASFWYPCGDGATSWSNVTPRCSSFRDFWAAGYCLSICLSVSFCLLGLCAERTGKIRTCAALEEYYQVKWSWKDVRTQ
ncbi:hypothetical protein HRR83_005043 [Exophiala dermatitidis]|uniref:Uncharacterized protein n=1 Tax=Exophiala dermatitidis TaxID=5970 RepID=A0AAN6EUS6_EXODE|nr:hypothetical protein HRR74_004793 [Exophiala dermatitidis]KAJ4519779.1 hypothetical protein HRR73_003839 [Exophiala dermatitidis]KAJ4534418.1 hypothetical protein HRR76_006343 [Exophiala dermatitidis]KAJ4541360.1 hypothetical protein HRR77_006157 [Exophiala dermatitidis]KAJ4564094.1 hypothetical protein HRR79_006120 [Exophiala dermatitidis]